MQYLDESLSSIIANCEHPMIQISPASRIIVDSSCVQLETEPTGIYGHRNGIDGYGSEHGIGVVSDDVSVSGRLPPDDGGCTVRAGSTHCCIGVGVLGLNAVLHGILETVIHESPVAALVAIGSGAINQLLF